MGELHVNMITTLDGVIQANGGPTEQDAGFEYAGWERPFWDDDSSKQIEADVQGSDALLLGRTTYDIFRGYWPDQSDEIGSAFNRVPKYVASRGRPELSWEASTQVNDVPAEVRTERLVARHVEFGKSPTAARAWVATSSADFPSFLSCATRAWSARR